jgi:hypothetical protein
VKTSELKGAALDWAVAKCEGATDEWDGYKPFFWRGVACIRIGGFDVEYTPSTDWALGGPIIEREGIAIAAHLDGDEWIAENYWREVTQTGPTPLIAAMRCYVASCLGDEVDASSELKGEEA